MSYLGVHCTVFHMLPMHTDIYVQLHRPVSISVIHIVSFNKELYTDRIQGLIFVHVFTNLFHKDFHLLVWLNCSYLYQVTSNCNLCWRCRRINLWILCGFTNACFINISMSSICIMYIHPLCSFEVLYTHTYIHTFVLLPHIYILVCCAICCCICLHISFCTSNAVSIESIYIMSSWKTTLRLLPIVMVSCGATSMSLLPGAPQGLAIVFVAGCNVFLLRYPLQCIY